MYNITIVVTGPIERSEVSIDDMMDMMYKDIIIIIMLIAMEIKL